MAYPGKGDPGVMNGDPADVARGEGLLRDAKAQGLEARPLAELAAWAGLRFLGAPYQASPLDREGEERLIVCLQRFDCLTFIESALAFALVIRRGSADFADYTAALTRIRYRRGRCNGYPSRLHYFSDWLFDNGRKGIVRDITAGLGGVPYHKRFHALTDRRASLPGLADPAAYRRMRTIEGICSRRPLSRLPRENRAALEQGIATGDLVAIATDQEGIDVIHVGIALREGAALRLLHASIQAGKVVLTEGNLSDYLGEKPTRTGVIVGRPLG